MDFSFKTNNNKEKKELPSVIKPQKRTVTLRQRPLILRHTSHVLNLPRVPAVQQIVHAFVFAVGHLLFHLVFVQLRVGGLLDVADHADGHGEVAAHAGQHRMDAGVLGGLVVFFNQLVSFPIILL